MKIALIAPPFICIPPKQYGGTELFIAQIARGLKQHGMEVVVYTNGESTIEVERRWLYAKAQWPIEGEVYDNLKDLNHSTWATFGSRIAGGSRRPSRLSTAPAGELDAAPISGACATVGATGRVSTLISVLLAI